MYSKNKLNFYVDMYIGFFNDQKELKVLIQQEQILSVKTKKLRKKKYVRTILLGAGLAFGPRNASATLLCV